MLHDPSKQQAKKVHDMKSPGLLFATPFLSFPFSPHYLSGLMISLAIWSIREEYLPTVIYVHDFWQADTLSVLHIIGVFGI